MASGKPISDPKGNFPPEHPSTMSKIKKAARSAK